MKRCKLLYTVLLFIIVLFTSAPLQAQTDTTPPNPNTQTTDSLVALQHDIIRSRERLGQLDTLRQRIKRAMALGNFIQRLDNLEAIKFPVVLADTLSGVPIAIIFDHLQIHPDYAQLAAYAMVELPQRNPGGMVSGVNEQGEGYIELVFGTPDLKFGHDGGIIGDARLGLLGDFPIGLRNPSKTAFILNAWRPTGTADNPGDAGTFITIDCDGFKEMGVSADILFSREWMLPIDQNEQIVQNRRVRGRVQTVIQDWNNLLVEVDLPNFALTKFSELTFNLSTAVFDFSDYRNSPNMQLPEGYAETYLPPGNQNLWRGVYIRELSMTLPKQFEGECAGAGTGMLLLDQTGEYVYGGNPAPAKSLPAPPTVTGPAPGDALALPVFKNPAPAAPPPTTAAPADRCRARVAVNDLIIDNNGVSGDFRAENVLPGGSMDGWPFTVDRLRVGLRASRLRNFGFGGRLEVNVAKSGEAFEYDAFINPPDRTYNFRVETTEAYTFSAFKMGEVRIDSASYLNIDVVEGRFRPRAVLYGYAAISGKLNSKDDDSNLPANKKTFTAARINFAGLYLSTTDRPVGLIQGGSLSFGEPPKLLKYPLPVSDPKLVQQENGVGLGINAKLNLMSQSDNGFAAGTDVAILGKPATEAGSKKYQSDGLTVSSIYARLKTPGLQIRGYAHIFEDDPVYGRGFQGSLDVRVGKDTVNPLFLLELNAMFGQTDYKYWYVDGFVELDRAGVPLIPGVLEANGFGGGAYYHMKMAGADLINGGDGSLGTMSSGVRYEPNESVTLGLKASIAVRSPAPTETVDGVATFELAFSGTGLQDIMFYGRAEFVSPAVTSWMKKKGEGLQKQLVRVPDESDTQIERNEQEIKGQRDAILASLFLRMNFEYGFEFQGTFRAQISAAQGKIVGSGAVDILISKPRESWHFYIGGYSDGSIRANDGARIYPVDVTLNLGSGVRASAGAYFLMGNDIPGPPPIHPRAAAYFGVGSRPNGRNGNLDTQAARGAGFAFGAYIFAYIEGRTRKKGKRERNWMTAELAAGFDISLLKYAANTRCNADSRKSPHGHKGWRATGRIWAYVNADARYWGVRKRLSVGALIQGDLPNPTYLDVVVKVKVVWNFTVRVKIGKECGRPVVAALPQDPLNYQYAQLKNPLPPPTVPLGQWGAGGAGGGL